MQKEESREMEMEGSRILTKVANETFSRSQLVGALYEKDHAVIGKKQKNSEPVPFYRLLYIVPFTFGILFSYDW